MNETSVLKKHPLDLALDAALNGNFDESNDILESLPKDDYRVIFNLGWHKIRNGDLYGGFDRLNAGRFINCFGLPPIKGKIWKNENLNGKVLLFRCEGGYGDQILNIRFAREFEKMGARVIVGCDPDLSGLFTRNGFLCIDNSSCEKVYYDYWVPAMSAPYILKLTYESLNGTPYLESESKKMYSKKDTLKVGLRWSGSPEFEHEQHRRFNSELMIDLHSIDGITAYSLQRDENLIHGLPFSDMKDEMVTWEDTAKIIKGLDLVITSCTSIAHLSGALGVETWVIVPILPYYTWALPKDTTLWYNSVKIFRQEVYGNWDAPFEKVKNELIKKVGERK